MKVLIYFTALALFIAWFTGMFYFSAGYAIHILPIAALTLLVAGTFLYNLWQMRHLFNHLFTTDNQYNH